MVGCGAGGGCCEGRWVPPSCRTGPAWKIVTVTSSAWWVQGPRAGAAASGTVGEGAARCALGPWGRGSGSDPDARVPRLGPAGAGAAAELRTNPGKHVCSPTILGSGLGVLALFSCFRLFLTVVLSSTCASYLAGHSHFPLCFVLNYCFSPSWPCIPSYHFPLLPIFPVPLCLTLVIWFPPINRTPELLYQKSLLVLHFLMSQTKTRLVSPFDEFRSLCKNQ